MKQLMITGQDHDLAAELEPADWNDEDLLFR